MDVGAVIPLSWSIVTTESEKTYEMLWDCRYCGTKKLLGKSHRHCPECGGEQDATARYFPSDTERVAVEDHVYVGADVACGSCGTYNSRAAKCCTNCGGALSPDRVVMTRQEQVYAEGQAYQGETAAAARAEFRTGQAAPPAVAGGLGAPQSGKKRRFWLLGCAGVLLVVVAVVAFVMWLFRSEATQVTVTEVRWERSIAVEKREVVTATAWCDELPPGARELERTRAPRGREQVADGEDCQLRKVDRGDGTFVEKRTCKPRTKNQTRMSDQCRYKAEEWRVARTETAQGATNQGARLWPTVNLTRPGDCVGCERLGRREEKLLLRVRDRDGAEQVCAVSESLFGRVKLSDKLPMKRTVIGKLLECTSLGQ